MGKIVAFVCIFLCIGFVFGSINTRVRSNSAYDGVFGGIDYAYDIYEEKLYSNGDRVWGWWWPDFPERIEPFFDLEYEIDESMTEDMNEMNGIALADFNDDGLLDVAVSWKKIVSDIWSHISIFYNQGEDLGFTAVKIFDLDYPATISDLDAADYDNDGDVDLFFTYSEHVSDSGLFLKINGTGKILLNDGQNNFNTVQTAFWHGPGDPENIVHNRINPQVSSVDFDDDGDIDFIVGDNTGLVAFYKNDGSGNFSWVCDSDFKYTRGYSWGVAGGDFNNDGNIDFIVTEFPSWTDGFIYLKYNDGTDSCFNHSNYKIIAEIPDYDNLSFFATPTPLAQGCLSAIDYNDDGMMDFVFGGSGYVLMDMQVEPGVFEQFTVCRLPAENLEKMGGFEFEVNFLRLGGIAVGDVNNDGLEDVMIGGSNNIIETLYNNCNLVDIIFPDGARLIKNNEIVAWFLPIYPFLKHGTSIVQGDVTVVAKGLEPLSKVEFYLDNKLVNTDDTSPYEWNWDRFSFGRHKVKAVAYDMDGEQAGFDDTIVWKFI